MKSLEQYKEEFEAHIARIKAGGGKGFLQFGLEMSRTTALMLEKHFIDQGIYYDVEFRVCPRGLWDCVIRWR